MDNSNDLDTGPQDTVSDSNDQNEKHQTIPSKIKLIFTNITVEPIMVAVVLPGMMSVLTIQNLILEKSCRVNLALGNEICDALTSGNESYPEYKTYEVKVQKLSATMTIGINIMQSVFPAILLLFLGSWSDRHKKRKPCYMLSMTGEICICILLLISTYYFYELPVEFTVLAAGLPLVFSGAWATLFLGVYSYISNITTEETRTVRIGACHTLFSISFCVGSSLSGIVFQELGYYGVYSLSLSIYLSGYIYGTFFIKDICDLERITEDNIETKPKKKNWFADFFDFKTVSKTLKLTFKDDGNKRRLKMFLVIILGYVATGPLVGELGVTYYFSRYKFGWNSVDYSLFSTFKFLITTTGSLFTLTFLAKIVKLDDSILGMLAVISKVTGSLIFAFAPSPLIFYIGAFAELMSNISFICMRSIISKSIPPEELGAVNSVIGFSEAFIPLTIGPSYSKLYAATILYFPGACYLLSAGITLPGLFVFFWFYKEHKKADGVKDMFKSQKEALMENYTCINSNNSNNTKKISISLPDIQNDLKG